MCNNYPVKGRWGKSSPEIGLWIEDFVHSTNSLLTNIFTFMISAQHKAFGNT